MKANEYLRGNSFFSLEAIPFSIVSLERIASHVLLFHKGHKAVYENRNVTITSIINRTFASSKKWQHTSENYGMRNNKQKLVTVELLT